MEEEGEKEGGRKGHRVSELKDGGRKGADGCFQCPWTSLSPQASEPSPEERRGAPRRPQCSVSLTTRAP